MQQFWSIKDQHKDCIILFRMGDFYETFEKDAELTSKILGIALTKRANGAAASVALAGFPYHSLEQHLYKLLKAGNKVAICEQMEDASQTKGIVKREVVEIVSPGMNVSEKFLDGNKNNYICSLFYDRLGVGISILDYSTGEFYTNLIKPSDLDNIISKYDISELIIIDDQKKIFKKFKSLNDLYTNTVPEWVNDYEFNIEILCNHFNVKSLKGFGLKDKNASIISSGMLIHYLKENFTSSAPHIDNLKILSYNDAMQIDYYTIKNLEIFESLLNDNKDSFAASNREKQTALVKAFEDRRVNTVSYLDALQKRFTTDWTSADIQTPEFTGLRVIEKQSLQELVDYIDWTPFFMTWELKGKYPRIFEHPTLGEPAKELFENAQILLQRIVDEDLFQAKAVYGFWPAHSINDDILLFQNDARQKELARLHALRQQTERKGQAYFRSLADYIAPHDSGRADYVGAFAVTTGFGCKELATEFDAQSDDYNSIMVKALADRLAEAFAESLHQQVRAQWRYGANESLTKNELIAESYRGIRPAPGYPAQPDHTEKNTIWNLLDVEANTGIKLTDSYAMMPAASVSGLYFAHPEARYFAVDRITRDQVESYAQRKGMSIQEMERWLAPILGY